MLRDALATALHTSDPSMEYLWSPALREGCDHREQADHILSDPAFRLALTESIAEALVPEWKHNPGCTDCRYEAAAIVARMLGVTP
jgi:hypothetical protein